MHEGFERPEVVQGATIRILPVGMEASIFITINHVTLNEGTQHQEVRPLEVFINSKHVESQQWITFATRLLSAVFRKGGDVTFVIDEMKNVHDPRGGYFLPGGTLCNSIVAHIGIAIEEHFFRIGVMKKAELSPEVKAVVEAKKAEAEQSGALAHAKICDKCHEKQVVVMDGCETCLGCGYSKCG